MRRPTSPIQRTKLPELSPFGIMSPAVEYIYDTKDSWLDGYTYETPDARVAISLGEINFEPTTATTDSVEASADVDLFREVKPVNVRISMTTSTFARDYDELEDTVKSLLKPMIQKAIEREFWNGVISSAVQDAEGNAINRWLDDGQAVIATLPGTTGPLKTKVGMAMLEQALVDSTIGSRGCIHLPRAVAAFAGLEEDEETLYTKLKTPVVAGTGYQLEADGHTAWIFGTGPVTVRQGKPIIQSDERGALDRATNTYNIVFNVPVAVTWSTSELQAVQIDLSLENS